MPVPDGGSESRKRNITHRFDSATGYDRAARLQRRCATMLAEQIASAFHTSPPAHILEFGAGTGFLTQALARHFPTTELWATDISSGMLERLRANHPAVRAHLRIMDAEQPHADFPAPFDLITSSLCLQWFTDRKAGLERLIHLLAPSGKLMVTTLLAGSLKEWRNACARSGAPCGVPDYPTVEELQAEWPAGGTGRWMSQPLMDPVGNARSFLRGLHRIGASRPREGSVPASPTALKQAMSCFDEQSCNGSDIVERHVTYQIGFGLFKRTSA